MEEMFVFTNPKYSNGREGTPNSVECEIDGKHHTIPIDLGNRHYAELIRQVEAGEITIADAEAS